MRSVSRPRRVLHSCRYGRRRGVRRCRAADAALAAALELTLRRWRYGGRAFLSSASTCFCTALSGLSSGFSFVHNCTAAHPTTAARAARQRRGGRPSLWPRRAWPAWPCRQRASGLRLPNEAQRVECCAHSWWQEQRTACASQAVLECCGEARAVLSWRPRGEGSDLLKSANKQTNKPTNNREQQPD